MDLPGLTNYNLSLVTPPVLAVEPAPSGKSRVRVKETSTVLAPIEINFLAPGKYPSHDVHPVVCQGKYMADNITPCTPGKFPIVYDVDDAGSAQLMRAEEEHCQDCMLAFFLILGGAANEVNRLATSGKTFASLAAAEKELSKTVKLAPAKWLPYFHCLAEAATNERDRKRGPYGWHDLRRPNKERVVLGRDSTSGGKVALYPVILPEVSHHLSWEVIQAVMSACNAKFGSKP